MKIYDNTKYAFIIPIIRSYESRMLNAGEVERMLGAQDAREAYRVLNDSDYAKFLGDSDKIEDFQIVINEGLLEIKELFLKNAPYQELLDIIWLRFDFSNLKAFLKAQIQGKNFQTIAPMFFPFGKYTFEEMSDFFTEAKNTHFKNKNSGEKAKLEKVFQKAIQDAMEIYTKTEDPRFVDVVVDRAYYAYLEKILKLMRNRFVSDYYHLEIDLQNIKSYLRLLILEKRDNFTDFYLQGGSLNVDFFEGNFEDFLKKFEKTLWHVPVKKAIETFVEKHSFVDFEKETNALLLDHMIKARYITLGIEPLFAFFWMKENNAQIIRTIMVGKLNGVETGEIRKKLRKLYQ